jgi:hypothetical protein
MAYRTDSLEHARKVVCWWNCPGVRQMECRKKGIICAKMKAVAYEHFTNNPTVTRTKKGE